LWKAFQPTKQALTVQNFLLMDGCWQVQVYPISLFLALLFWITVFTSGPDGRVLVSSTVNGRLIKELGASSAAINSVAWLPRDGNLRCLATAGADECVNIWKFDEQRKTRCLPVAQQKFGSEVKELKYDLASGQLLIAFNNGLSIWDLNDLSHNPDTKVPLPLLDTVGGLCFLATGTLCVVSLPDARHL
jgi:WD40 repeat protein